MKIAKDERLSRRTAVRSCPWARFTAIREGAESGPYPPDSLSQEWARLVRRLKLPRVTLPALRHTHASQLIAAGMDVVAVSRRLGHGNPAVTLGVYSHLFGNTDGQATEIVERAMSKIMTERDGG